MPNGRFRAFGQYLQNVNRMLFEAQSAGRITTIEDAPDPVTPPVTPVGGVGPLLSLRLYRQNSPLADEIGTVPMFNPGFRDYEVLIARDRRIVHMAGQVVQGASLTVNGSDPMPSLDGTFQDDVQTRADENELRIVVTTYSLIQ